MNFNRLNQYLSDNDEEVHYNTPQLEAARKEIPNLKPLINSFSDREFVLTQLLTKEDQLHSVSF